MRDYGPLPDQFLLMNFLDKEFIIELQEITDMDDETPLYRMIFLTLGTLAALDRYGLWIWIRN